MAKTPRRLSTSLIVFISYYHRNKQIHVGQSMIINIFICRHNWKILEMKQDFHVFTQNLFHYCGSNSLIVQHAYEILKP